MYKAGRQVSRIWRILPRRRRSFVRRARWLIFSTVDVADGSNTNMVVGGQPVVRCKKSPVLLSAVYRIYVLHLPGLRRTIR